MLFISPPFGNYISLPYTTCINGSFTLHPRDGLIIQIIKTLRYSFYYGGWTNKIGLRNKGIDYGLTKKGITSIAILNENEIDEFVNRIPDNQNLELNISCPNLDKHMVQDNLHKFVSQDREWCIVKLSPNDTIETVDKLYKQGFRQFHCCNTLPVKEGGLSGKTLIPIVSKKIKQIKEKYPDTTIIAGGGIKDIDTLKMYKECGADHFSVSTIMFNPFKFVPFYYNYYKMESDR